MNNVLYAYNTAYKNIYFDLEWFFSSFHSNKSISNMSIRMEKKTFNIWINAYWPISFGPHLQMVVEYTST